MNSHVCVLGLTQDATAEHEAGHLIVAHIRGQEPYCVLMEDKADGTHTGQVQSRSPIVEGQEIAHLRMLLAVAVAGILAEIKGLASRHVGEIVRFEPGVRWGDLFQHLVGGVSNISPPILHLRAKESGKTVDVSSAFSSEYSIAFNNDRQDIRDHAYSFQELGEDPLAEAEKAFLETAELLDRPEIWEVVLFAARELINATPTLLRRLDGLALKKILCRIDDNLKD